MKTFKLRGDTYVTKYVMRVGPLKSSFRRRGVKTVKDGSNFDITMVDSRILRIDSSFSEIGDIKLFRENILKELNEH